MQSKKQDEWRKRIEEWKHSGLNQAEYCREQNWSLANFWVLEAETGKEDHTTALRTH